MGNLGRQSSNSVKDDDLIDRVRSELSEVGNLGEKRMFGGVGFMVNGKLCLSVRGSRMMCRVDPARHDDLVARKGCSPVIMKGQEYKGYVRVDERGLSSSRDLQFWVGPVLDFNARLTVRHN